jgi:molybdopterin converting factor small subunit
MSGEVTVRLFAAAAHAAGHTEVCVDATSVPQALAAVTAVAVDPRGFAAVLERCSLLVDGVADRVDSQARLQPGATVDVLPPFAGG